MVSLPHAVPIFLRASAIARSESIDDIWLLLLLLLARFVKYSNIEARVPLDHGLLRSEMELMIFSRSAICLHSADCLLFAVVVQMDSLLQNKDVGYAKL